jgi:hypothetical protein
MASKEPFSKVKEARQALASKSLELFEQYQSLIKDAIAAQEFDVAQKGLQFLLEHLPKDEDGLTMLDRSVDAKQPVDSKKGPSGPTIQIGIALTAPKPQSALPEAVIDLEPLDEQN